VDAVVSRTGSTGGRQGENVKFATDSPLEGAGFEPSVPLGDRGTLQLYSELFDLTIATHYGRLVKTIGDGFSSSSAMVDALRCASEV
jgi:hypothetical protein